MTKGNETKRGLKMTKKISFYDSLTEYFRDTRTLKALGMPTIADATGFHTSNLSRIERSVHRPTVDTLDRLSTRAAYGCPWWSVPDNARFLRALAYHLTESTQYAPRDMEWWPADMTLAVSAAGVITQGTTWSHSVRWSDLVELWPALNLPGWQPDVQLADHPAAVMTRPLWLWGAWTVTLELKDDDDGMAVWAQNIRGRDDTDLATTVLGAIVESVERWRRSQSPAPGARPPTDPDFQAILTAWPGLSTAHRRLVRATVEALPQQQ